MAGVKGKSGRHESDVKREGYFFRLRPAVITRVERCTPLLEMQEGVRMSKAEALEHLLTMACEALERTREGRETPAPISISKISEISGDDISVPGYGFPEDEDETLAPASHTNGQGAPAPQPTAQPAIPLALEPAPKTAQPVDVPQVSETPEPAVQTVPAEHTQDLPQHIQTIAETRAQYDKLSLAEFSQLLFDRDIYRARDRQTGEEKPVNRGTLDKWLRQARDAGVL